MATIREQFTEYVCQHPAGCGTGRWLVESEVAPERSRCPVCGQPSPANAVIEAEYRRITEPRFT